MLCNVKFIADKTLGKLGKNISDQHTQLKVNSSDTNRTLLVFLGVIIINFKQNLQFQLFLRNLSIFFNCKLYRFFVQKGQFASI